VVGDVVVVGGVVVEVLPSVYTRKVYDRPFVNGLELSEAEK
jgi:hypothetical protein